MKEMAVACFEVLSLNLPRRTKEKHEKPQSEELASKA
jgi:hypothetical protein